MTAYAYLRKSVQKAGATDVSHESQESGIRELAKRHGDGGDLVFLSDWNVSGRLGPSRRPGYSGYVTMCKQPYQMSYSILSPIAFTTFAYFAISLLR